LFRDQRPTPVSGTAVTVTLDGKRPLIGEVQALVSETTAGNPRRATSGIDSSRAAMILAVLEKRAKLPLGTRDVYLSTVGGMRLNDPSSDLALAAAIASAAADVPMPADAVFIGEVGLAGDIRRVTGMDRRLAEAARLGFRSAVVPPGVKDAPSGLRISTIEDIGRLLHGVQRIADNGGRP
jgi:DNA repair protein RadA/Sms